MTKEDVKKRLECVARITGNDLLVDAYKIITEQEKEIERLKEEKKQAQIDVLNKVKEHLFFCVGLGFLRLYVDELIEEVEAK